jgi:hypothetical protein
MTEIVERKPEFRALAEDAVVAALQDPDPANRLAIEVARLLDGYTRNFQAHVQGLGRIPSDILRKKPRWHIGRRDAPVVGGDPRNSRGRHAGRVKVSEIAIAAYSAIWAIALDPRIGASDAGVLCDEEI